MRFARPAPSSCLRVAAALAVAVVVAGCASARRVAWRSASRGSETRPLPPGADGPGTHPPADLASLPDAEPRVEPIRSGGPNKPYQVLGRDYVPATRDLAFSERGLASWYGVKFHGRRTASGEVYDMYAMTAAHPTLPIPSYARIRNPANGREILVRVNDRGPFHPGRIVDLSYAAAVKLDLLRGVAPVELDRITFEDIRTGAWRSRGGEATRLAAAPASSDAATWRSRPIFAAAPPSAPIVMSAPVPLPAQDVAFVSDGADASCAAGAGRAAGCDDRRRSPRLRRSRRSRSSDPRRSRHAASGSSSAPFASATAPRASAVASAPTTTPAGSRRCWRCSPIPRCIASRPVRSRVATRPRARRCGCARRSLWCR